MEGNEMKIAGLKTVTDWQKFVPILKKDPSPENWNEAYNRFLYERINTRYFKPIELLEDHGKNEGEGFAIVTIQCCLIEFLASIRLRTTFTKPDTKKCNVSDCTNKIIDNTNKINPSKIFTSFIKSNKPFATFFDSSNKADSFYHGIRCSLLHDAQTRDKWLIRAKVRDEKLPKDALISWNGPTQKKILFRNNLQQALETYLVEYSKDLQQCKSLQAAFIKKFNSF